jgi:uncharacterized membrane protein
MAEDAKVVYSGASIGAIDMSLFAILLFVGTMVLSLWATMRVRQVYGKFSQLPASSGDVLAIARSASVIGKSSSWGWCLRRIDSSASDLAAH